MVIIISIIIIFVTSVAYDTQQIRRRHSCSYRCHPVFLTLYRHCHQCHLLLFLLWSSSSYVIFIFLNVNIFVEHTFSFKLNRICGATAINLAFCCYLPVCFLMVILVSKHDEVSTYMYELYSGIFRGFVGADVANWGEKRGNCQQLFCLRHQQGRHWGLSQVDSFKGLSQEIFKLLVPLPHRP